MPTRTTPPGHTVSDDGSVWTEYAGDPYPWTEAQARSFARTRDPELVVAVWGSPTPGHPPFDGWRVGTRPNH